MSDLQQATVTTQVRLAIKVAGLSATLIIAAWRFALRQLQKEQPGVVSIRKLMRSNVELQRMDMQSVDVKELSQLAKQHGVSFSVVQDLTAGSYTLFFKSANIAQMEACIEAYMRKHLDLDKQQLREPFAQKSARAQARAGERSREETPQRDVGKYNVRGQEIGERELKRQREISRYKSRELEIGERER